MRAAGLIIGFVVAVLGLAACTGPPHVAPSPPAPILLDSAATRSAVAPSDPPAFVFPSLDDSTVVFTLEAFAGRFVLIDFWATWCGPCVAEIPNIDAVHSNYAARGFDVLSVSLDFERSQVETYDHPLSTMDWHHAFVKEGFSHPSVQAFGVDRLPYAVLIGPDGTVRARAGHLRRDLLRITVDREITAHEAAHAPSP